MKKNSFLWAALSMTAALVMTACSNDDNANESPAQQNAAKNIPYTVTVNGGEGGATTRATVDSDNKTLKFADGDKLYVSGTNIKGVLDIQSGVGDASNATFSGDLTYSGEGSPADNLQLTATLVSAQQTVGTQVSVDDAGAVTVNYPKTAYCTSVNDAVQKYSNLTGTSTYGTKSFSLTQQTAFLNFVITFEDGTTTGTELTAVVNNNSSNICSASVTTETVSEKVVAKFVLPVAAGTTLSSANVKMGDKEAITLVTESKTLTAGKIYNINRSALTYPIALSAVTSSYVGSVVTTDGNVYATVAAASTDSKTAVAVIAYVGTAGSVDASSASYKGLAIALSDANGGSNCQWANESVNCLNGIGGQTNSIATALGFKNGITCTSTLTSDVHTHAAATAAVSNNGTAAPKGTSGWFMPSMGQWNLIVQGLASKKAGTAITTDLTTSVNNTYKADNLNSVITAAGGTGFKTNNYWASTEATLAGAWVIYFTDGNAIYFAKTTNRYVRSVIAF